MPTTSTTPRTACYQSTLCEMAIWCRPTWQWPRERRSCGWMKGASELSPQRQPSTCSGKPKACVKMERATEKSWRYV
eukprot:5831456-Pyramimonas_sp.AAC.1